MPRHSTTSERNLAKPPKKSSKAPSVKAAQGGGNGEDRQHMISTAAYYRAERRGFNGGDEVQDWLEAEAEIDATLCH